MPYMAMKNGTRSKGDLLENVTSVPEISTTYSPYLSITE
jgi:hypothetical protein